MKRITQKVLARDSKRDIGAEVLQAVTEIKSGKGRRYALAIPEAARARQSIGVTQSEFAVMLGVSVRTLQDWEQGRREPSGAAKSLLRVAAAAPRVVRKVLDMA